MNNKRIHIPKENIFVSAERCFSDREAGDFTYNLWIDGECAVTSLTEAQVKAIADCIQYALSTNKKDD